MLDECDKMLKSLGMLISNILVYKNNSRACFNISNTSLSDKGCAKDFQDDSSQQTSYDVPIKQNNQNYIFYLTVYDFYKNFSIAIEKKFIFMFTQFNI